MAMQPLARVICPAMGTHPQSSVLRAASTALWPFLLPSLLTGCVSPPRTDAIAYCDIAQRYIDAANHSAPDSIERFLAADSTAVFLTLEADHPQVIEGRDAVLDAVRSYKEDCPTCESTMTCMMETSSAAYVLEHVAFRNAGGEQQSQSAPLILEFDGTRIVYLIYYPAN